MPNADSFDVNDVKSYVGMSFLNVLEFKLMFATILRIGFYPKHCAPDV